MSEFSNIYQFTDFRKFLADYQENRQAAEPSFTRTEFCIQLGLPHTRSYFNDVVQGRRVTKNMLWRFVRVIGLNGTEASYFEAMIRFGQSKNGAAREAALNDMMKINPNPQAIVDPDSYAFFGAWYNSTVFAILDVLNVGDDLSELSGRIFPPVPLKKLKESLALMQKMNLVRKNAHGYWKPTRDSLSTVQQSKDKLILQYQKQCLELSRQALESAGGESRDMTTFTFSVSPRARKLIDDETEHYKSRIRRIVVADKDAPTGVEHINLHLLSNLTGEVKKK